MDATYPPGPDPITTRSTSPKQCNKISFKSYHLLRLIYIPVYHCVSHIQPHETGYNQRL